MSYWRRYAWLVSAMFCWGMVVLFGFVALALSRNGSPNWPGFLITSGIFLVLAVVVTALFRRALRSVSKRQAPDPRL